MRITTKVMQNNSLSNINTNKRLQDQLNTQMATEKKINRPSEDPVVAIRALRLRTNVSQITQYYDKNSKDAESWLSVTEDALTTVSAVIEDLIEQTTKGANENLTSADRNTILNALKELRNEVYATGNADYAGRSIFTGYRTESSLKYKADTVQKYSITEEITSADIDTITYVKTGKLNGINDANFKEGAAAGIATIADGADGAGNAGGTGGDATISGSTATAGSKDYANIVERDVVATNIYRIRLAYSDVDGVDKTTITNDKNEVVREAIPTIKLYDPNHVNPDGTKGAYVEAKIDTDGDGVADSSINIQTLSVNNNLSPYDVAASDANKNGAVLIKETGELLIGEEVYKQLMKQEDNVNTAFDETSLLITYEKSNWEKDDLRPEHYFKCEDLSDLTNTITYNSNYINPGEVVEKQVIEYDIGMNQTIRVNTTADEVFVHAIGRDVDDMIAAMQEVVDMEETVARLESMVADAKYGEEERKIINNQLEAAKKALTYLDEKAQKLFESSISKMQGHLDTANLATTNCGSRGMKLELIQNRLTSQKTNFENLESENENVDVTEVAVKLTSAELTYEAALMATGKIMQTSLMNYI